MAHVNKFVCGHHMKDGRGETLKAIPILGGTVILTFGFKLQMLDELGLSRYVTGKKFSPLVDSL